ncbi:MAG: aldehyde dehydrogenase (NADP(+)) [Acidobacteriota bacterium]
MEIELRGTSIIGSTRGAESDNGFRAFNPRTGEAVEPHFYSASNVNLETAADLASAARIPFANTSGASRARLLDLIAGNIEKLGDRLIERASLETGLSAARLTGERARTCGQLRSFARLLLEGSWVDARIDHAIPDRQLFPKPDIRSMFRPIGPVAVFCASNFPLAYSVAGGDTASALAAGCPVIVNAHSAHPGTAELTGNAVAAAVRECEMPEGVFSLLFSAGYEIGQTLVGHPEIKGVGFTGSRRGGRALMDIASARPEPIPVYAEMSSVNPTFILNNAIDERGEDIARALHRSVTNDAGQFCTKPGLVFIESGEQTEDFVRQFRSLIAETHTFPLLTAGIQKSYLQTSGRRRQKVNTFIEADNTELNGFSVRPAVFETSTEQFLSTDDLNDEIFGPATLLIRSNDHEEILAAARALEGQLTASIHGTEADLAAYSDLISVLETKVGRLIFNGFSTGVEVCPSMVHGGPYPATSDGRSTAVGTRAIERFSRLVCYQNFPEASLPDELKEANPLGIRRMIDGRVENS